MGSTSRVFRRRWTFSDWNRELLATSDSFYASATGIVPGCANVESTAKRASTAKGESPLSDLRLKLYERALARDPRNHFLLLDLAREYGRHRRVAEADQVLRRLVELYPASALIRSQAATSYAAIGLTQRAIEHYRCSLRMDPTQPDAAEIREKLAGLIFPLLQPAAG